MFTARFRLAAVLLSFMTAFSIAPAAKLVAGDLQEWVVVQIEGPAEFKRGDPQWRPLRRGDTVIPGYEIRTGPGAKVLLSRGTESITIEPKSTLEFLPPGSNSVTRIFQKIGGAIFKIKKRNRKHFEVLTPNFVATVKGTEFSIRADASGTTLSVTSGTVGVTNKKSGKSVDVSAGQFAMAVADGGAIATGNLTVRTTSPLMTYSAIIAVLAAVFGFCFVLYVVVLRKRARTTRTKRQAVRR